MTLCRHKVDASLCASCTEGVPAWMYRWGVRPAPWHPERDHWLGVLQMLAVFAFCVGLPALLVWWRR